LVESYFEGRHAIPPVTATLSDLLRLERQNPWNHLVAQLLQQFKLFILSMIFALRPATTQNPLNWSNPPSAIRK